MKDNEKKRKIDDWPLLKETLTESRNYIQENSTVHPQSNSSSTDMHDSETQSNLAHVRGKLLLI